MSTSVRVPLRITTRQNQKGADTSAPRARPPAPPRPCAGCVPKKVMYNAALVRETLAIARDYGFAGVEPRFSWPEVKAKRDAYVARLNGIYASNLDNSRVARFQGRACFVGPRTVRGCAGFGGRGASVTPRWHAGRGQRAAPARTPCAHRDRRLPDHAGHPRHEPGGDDRSHAVVTIRCPPSLQGSSTRSPPTDSSSSRTCRPRPRWSAPATSPWSWPVCCRCVALVLCEPRLCRSRFAARGHRPWAAACRCSRAATRRCAPSRCAAGRPCPVHGRADPHLPLAPRWSSSRPSRSSWPRRAWTCARAPTSRASTRHDPLCALGLLGSVLDPRLPMPPPARSTRMARSPCTRARAWCCPATTPSSWPSAARQVRGDQAAGTCVSPDHLWPPLSTPAAAPAPHAATSGLGLDAAGVRTNDLGAVEVDSRHATSAENVWAVGDVISRVDLTPVAIQAGRRLGACASASRLGFPHAPRPIPSAHRNTPFPVRAFARRPFPADALFGGRATVMEYDNIPTVVFSHPPIGTVGLTEAEARARHGADSVVVYKRCAAAHEPSALSRSYFRRPQLLHQHVLRHVRAQTQDRHEARVRRRARAGARACAEGIRAARPASSCLAHWCGPQVVGLHVVGMGADEMLQGFGVAIKARASPPRHAALRRSPRRRAARRIVSNRSSAVTG